MIWIKLPNTKKMLVETRNNIIKRNTSTSFDPSRVTYGGIVYMKSVSADVEITTRLVISTSARQSYHLFARMCMKIFIGVLCVGFRSGSNMKIGGTVCGRGKRFGCKRVQRRYSEKADNNPVWKTMIE
ncbi:hypothetical protein T4E_10595 [Trichinella pseudospiralis]|uniref:Uncharacterized protein n=1 Tax=Trichinella pseudospiralis TaxID=6337 RepID=A0A0V0Y625_TRIPS|nr:hypothetical protein T4E_10595 [Trichinella pseudospiralis]